MTWEEKNLGIINCLGCGKQFAKKTETQKFCKQTCRMKYHYIPASSLKSIICPHCEMEFSIKLIKGNKK